MADDTETGESIRALARRSEGDGAAQGVERKKNGAAKYAAASNGGYAYPGEEAEVVTRAAALGHPALSAGRARPYPHTGNHAHQPTPRTSVSSRGQST